MLEGYNDVMTIEELAEALMIGRNYAYRLCRDGSISAFHIGTKWRIPKIAVQDFIYSKAQNKKNSVHSSH
ncbi:MAG: helix-turn-helix domain-containing protein [Lachnospiraceae bacterium]|nr:helix-turn-helix domain-containing protein [Lachnospiraceae bacterium]